MKCRLTVRVFMMTTSEGSAAPTMAADLAAQSAAMSCQGVRGELESEEKWPLTPMEAQVSSCASR